MLKFTKMHGLGNDFVVIDTISQEIDISQYDIQKLADRHFGIGFDQLLLIKQTVRKEADFYYQIFNADGSQAQQCGNGVRCIARFLLENQLITDTNVKLESKSGIVSLKVVNYDNIQVNMGDPIFEPAEIPFNAEFRQKKYNLHQLETVQEVMVVSMGNPHVVIKVENTEKAPVDRVGERISRHTDFPCGVNVGFMQVINPEKIKLRVFERGAGQTLACGSGACAAVVLGIINGCLKNTVTVELPGGCLTVHWLGEGKPVIMTGPAESVYQGLIPHENHYFRR
jgi:diaminopimelate epimerase